jgi:hypothetical protein
VTPESQGAGPGLLEQLRRMALYLETAKVLDLRASRSINATLAELLRERAAARRRVAEQFRAALLRDGVVVDRRGDRWGQPLRFRCTGADGGPGRR